MHPSAQAGRRSGWNWPRRSPERSPRPSRRGNACPLPGRVGVGARQGLDEDEQMAGGLAVMAAPSAKDRALVGRLLQFRFCQNRGDGGPILALELTWVR